MRTFLLVFSVAVGVVTTPRPVVAPLGIVAVISERDTTVNAAAAPLNATLVAPLRFVPKIVTDDPVGPELVCVSTKADSPSESLKTVPLLYVPPTEVVP